MTTGTSTFNARVPVAGSFETLYLGPASKRVWSGSDSPAPPAKRYEVLIPRYESHLLKPNGKPFVIPEYRKRVNTPTVVRRRDEHNYSVTAESGNGQLYKFNTVYTYGFGNTSVTNAPSAGIAVIADRNWSSNDDIVLINRLRKAMVGSDFDPAVFLATSSESLRMIGTAALRLNRSMTLLSRGRVQDAARILVKGTSANLKRHRNYNPGRFTKEDLASAQLELSYGWLPLLGDAYESANYVAHNTQLPQKLSFRVRYRRAFVQTSVSPSIWTFPKQKSYVRGQLIARMTEDFAFSQTYLAGFDDPLSMAWERLPWSFVADWFIPVQNYLMARQFARQVKGSFIKTTGWKVELPELKSSLSNYTITAPYTFDYRGVYAVRSVSTSLAVPYPKPKSLSSVPSWRRALNAVSLLTVTHSRG